MEEKNLFTPTEETPKIKVKGFETKNVPSWCKPIANIYQEHNYDRFTTFDENRAPDHVEGIIGNILSRGYIENPISCCVNVLNPERLIILDGNNRFNALKELELPISFYLVEDGNNNDMITLNLISKNWNKVDFAKFWAKQGKRDYIVLLSYLDIYEGIGLESMVAILTGKTSRANTSIAMNSKETNFRETMGMLQKGTLALGDLEFANKILSFIKEIKDVDSKAKVWNKRHFISAIIKLHEHKDFNPNKMLTQYQQYHGKVYVCSKVTEYISVMEDIYNFKSDRKRVTFK